MVRFMWLEVSSIGIFWTAIEKLNSAGIGVDDLVKFIAGIKV